MNKEQIEALERATGQYGYLPTELADQALAEIWRLRRELDWYADPTNFDFGNEVGAQVNWDNGKRARAALGQEVEA